MTRPDLLVHAGDMLRQVGLRRTPGRVALLAVLVDAAPDHLVLAEVARRVHEAGWPIDRSSIHRAMADLQERRLVHTLPVAGPVAFGPALPAHHHLVCRSCETVTVIPVEDLATTTTRACTTFATHAAPAVAGFRLDEDGLALFGRCARCAERT